MNHTWTEGGKELLRIIENEIKQSGGITGTIKKITMQGIDGNQCTKKDCYFCEKMFPNRIVPKIKEVKPRLKHKSKRWSADEDLLMEQCICLPSDELFKQFPNRTPFALISRRAKAANNNGYLFNHATFRWYKPLPLDSVVESL